MKDRTLLMIPGPIEFDPAVLATLGEPTTSHLAPEFIEAFGYALEQLQHVFLCQDGQPFVLAGSGTLAMDAAGANLVEPGDKAWWSKRAFSAIASQPFWNVMGLKSSRCVRLLATIQTQPRSCGRSCP